MTIAKWLQQAFTDEKLMQFREHCASGKLVYKSCCCLIGAPFANHEDGEMRGEYREAWPEDALKQIEYARSLPEANSAEYEFLILGKTDVERRERILPMIDAEIARRELSCQPNDAEKGEIFIDSVL